MNRKAAGALMGMLMTGWCAAQTTLPGGSDNARIQNVLQRLSDSDFGVRTKASQELAGLPPEAYDLFVKMIADPKTDEEVRARLAEALPALEAKSAVFVAKIRMEEDWAAEKATALLGYESCGNRDGRWDGEVHEALESYYGPTPGRPAAGTAEAFKKAIDAGCSDPVVLHLAANYALAQRSHDAGVIRAWSDRAARAFAASAGGKREYPAPLRLQGYLLALRALALAPGDADQDQALLSHWLEEAMGTWPEVAKDPAISSRRLYRYALALLDRAAAQKSNERWSVEIVRAPLAGTVQGEFTVSILDGKGDLRDAQFQETQGNDITRYLQGAKKNLERAAALDPLHQDPPNGMLVVAILLGLPRTEMETWYHRAMLTNPDNLEACISKLQYLARTSPEEMLKFGKECLEQGNFDTRIPTTLAVAHQFMQELSRAGDEYFASPAVWNDMHAVYSGMLKKNPKSLLYRSAEMKYAVLAGQWAVAAEDREVIGDHPDLTVFKTEENYADFCAQIAKHLRGSEARGRAGAAETRGGGGGAGGGVGGAGGSPGAGQRGGQGQGAGRPAGGSPAATRGAGRLIIR